MMVNGLNLGIDGVAKKAQIEKLMRSLKKDLARLQQIQYRTSQDMGRLNEHTRELDSIICNSVPTTWVDLVTAPTGTERPPLRSCVEKLLMDAGPEGMTAAAVYRAISNSAGRWSRQSIYYTLRKYDKVGDGPSAKYRLTKIQ